MPSSSLASIGDALRPQLLDTEVALGLELPPGPASRAQAAVLVALYVARGEPHAVFTRRRDDLRRHAGEISFPGGRHDPEDADLRATALREAHEEIGLLPDDVELLGALQPTTTVVTGFGIHPFVGLIRPGLRWRPSAAEVAQVIELPLRGVRDGHERRRLVRRGLPIRTDTYTHAGHLIWGATARIVGDLLRRAEPLLA